MSERELLSKEIQDAFAAEGIRLFRYARTDSTNKRAREYAQSEDAVCPALFWADGQTEGSGRFGRSFFSPDGTGLYMTLLSEVGNEDTAFSLLTALAAVCALEAIEESVGLRVSIKWVNDLYLDGKKVAGILAQSFFGGESRYVALGVGINISTQSFPDEIADKAGALLDGVKSIECDRGALALRFCERMLSALKHSDCSEYIEKYRANSCVLGKKVRFSQNGEEFLGRALDVTDSGALVVELEGGECMTLCSGEISLWVNDRE